MLRERFDIILGNPPWVAYRYVTDPDYQKEIKRRAVEEYQIAPRSQKLFTQMELATVFLAHSMKIFAREGATLAFVMPRSVLTADQHQNLIQRKYSAPFRITGFWDLRDVSPLFNVPSCVLFAQQSKRVGKMTEETPAHLWKAGLSRRDLPWNRVADKFTITHKTARVIWLGGRCALSTHAGASIESRSGSYARAFKQGATIVPRNLYFVSVDGLEQATCDPHRLYYCRTDEENALAAKQRYRDVRIQGSVEGRFLFSTALAKHILPFALLPPAPVVLPLEESNGAYYTVTTEALRRKGYRDFAEWMAEAEQVWNKKRGVKDSQSLLARLDYSRGLTAQSPTQRHLVLYAAAGTNVSACYCDRHALPIPFLAEHKSYWAAFSDPEEAHYLTAVLNAASVNEAIKPFQSTGLLGERDIEKKLLDVPFPLFNKALPTHKRLAELGRLAHIQANTAISDPRFAPGISLARQRAYVRTALSDVLGSIDLHVRELLRLL